MCFWRIFERARRSVCLFVFFFLNQSPTGEEQQRRLLCPLFLRLDSLESSLFKESHSLSLGKEWPVETKVRQPAGELQEAVPHRAWCVSRSLSPADHPSSSVGSACVVPAAGACGCLLPPCSSHTRRAIKMITLLYPTKPLFPRRLCLLYNVNPCFAWLPCLLHFFFRKSCSVTL